MSKEVKHKTYELHTLQTGPSSAEENEDALELFGEQNICDCMNLWAESRVSLESIDE